MTEFVSRAEWGARPRKSGTTAIVDHPSVTFHYVGGGWEFPWDHSSCDNKVREIQAYHMDGRGWSDIAYNYLPCPHDYLYEGRGYDRRSSANGSDSANNLSFAVCALWGTASADDPLPEGLKRAFLYARNILRTKGGATAVVKGHRDWKPTDCPGDQIYAWIEAGLPVAAPTPEPEDDMFTDKDRGRLDHIYGGFIDSDGSLSVTTSVGRIAQDLNEQGQALQQLSSTTTMLKSAVTNQQEQLNQMQTTLSAILQKLNATS